VKAVDSRGSVAGESQGCWGSGCCGEGVLVSFGEHGDLDDVVACKVGGVMHRDRLKSSSLSLRSSTSQRRFRVFFAGGRAVGEVAWARGNGDTRQCRCGGGVFTKGSVWALAARVVGLLRSRW
jgi:hypothetical protein